MNGADERGQSLEAGASNTLPPETVAPRPGRQAYPVTMAIIAVNVVLFLAVEATGGTGTGNLLRWGADFGPRTISGQWWRMLTAVFLHGGVAHIAVNMFSLWSVGPLLERLSGRWTYLLLYLSCGLGGSLASLWWHPMVVGVGASGAIFGIVGALLALLFLKHLPVQREWVQKNLVILSAFMLFNLLYGARSGTIDNAAHVGGLVTGLAIGLSMVTIFEPKESAWRRYAAFPVFAAVLVAGSALVQHNSTALLELATGTDLVEQQKYEDALPHLQRAVKTEPENAEAQFELGFAYTRLDRISEALGPMSEAVRLDPENYAAQFDLGLIYFNLHRTADALPHLKAAVDKHPDAETWYHFGMASMQANRRDDALHAMQQSLALDPQGRNAELARKTVELLQRGDAAPPKQ